MRWTFVLADSERIGGAERRLAESVPLLRAAGDHVELRMLTAPRNITARLLMQSGAPVTEARDRLCQHAAGEPHVVVTYGHRAALWTRLRKSRFGARCRLWQAQVGLDPGRSAVTRWADRATRGAVDAVVANSQAAAAKVIDEPGFAAGQVFVIESGLPAEWLAPVAKRGAGRTIAMIGSERPMKNLAGGLRVFAGLPEPRAQLVVFTDDGRGVTAGAADLGIEDRVTVHEGLSVEPQTYAGIDVLLHPSLSESLPRVVLEALAQRTPVAAYDVGDTARWVTRTAPVADEAALGRLVLDGLRGAGAGAGRPLRSTSDYVAELRSLAGDGHGT